MTSKAAQLASSWLQSFAKALESANVDAVVECFCADGFLRDILALNWDNRTLQGHSNISAYLVDFLEDASISAVELSQKSAFKPEYGRFTETLSVCGVSAGFTFETKIGPGAGYFTLVPDESDSWKALVVMIALQDIRGHEEGINTWRELRPPGPTWAEMVQQERLTAETEPDVLVVGAGQTGLNVAARFRQMGISTLVVERNHRVGDNWRQRYPTLTLHTPKNYCSMLYQQHPDNWPEFIPRDKVADWLEQYAVTQDLFVWTDSRPLPGARYDTSTKRWTVTIDRAGREVELHPTHIIVASALGAPRLPTIPNQSTFSGIILHSSQYSGAKSLAGKRVVVVGAGNTAAEICADLAAHKAQSVTMVQRSSTWIVSRDSAVETFNRMYPPDVDVADADFMAMARPAKLAMKLEKMGMEQVLESQKETHRGLAEAGFEINKSGKGFFTLWYERYGGFWLDTGHAELIRNGSVAVKHGVEVASFSSSSVIFSDNTSLEADCVIFATSCENIAETMRGVFGDAIIDQVGPVWGLDSEGELQGCYRRAGHPGLWFAGGEFYLSRAFSKRMALEIKAMQLGLLDGSR
ncbi:Flavin-binding monooxygenase [Mycena chlorophos]|uniref:Flavin-binding monooxygenase n=1 Tax=Mycena chlorophos TaxID=658473 RepID=A0A8H6WMW5_MYCCL|nr:Flavin-binding monooxygenase [Mycena chlorophos]